MIPVLASPYLSGRSLDYERYVRFQTKLRERRRELLLFCQHPPVLTAGVQSQEESLRTSATQREQAGVGIVAIGRGGDFTAHEPGQCVIYPHVDLRARDLKMGAVFADWLELTAAALRAVWDIEATNRTDAPGLYTPAGAKLVSIGLMFKGFFTSFGLAVNVANDLATFAHIHPCGQADLAMTSVAELGGDPERAPEFVRSWTALFADWLARTERAGPA